MSVPHPDWESPLDRNQTIAANTRLSILEEAANTNDKLILFHGDFPGIGRVIKTDKGFEFRKDRYAF